MAQIAIESGRIVLLPVQPDFYTPMIEYCWKQPFSSGKKLVFVRTTTHPRRVKKRKVVSVAISSCENDVKASSKIVLTSPVLVIGDATYIYVARRSSDEYDRAVAACKNEGRMSGAYRTDDGQIATAVRLGDKECQLDIEVEEGVVSIVRLADPALPR